MSFKISCFWLHLFQKGGNRPWFLIKTDLFASFYQKEVGFGAKPQDLRPLRAWKARCRPKACVTQDWWPKIMFCSTFYKSGNTLNRMSRIWGEKPTQLVGWIWTYNSTMRFFTIWKYENYQQTIWLKNTNYYHENCDLDSEGLYFEW